MTQKINSEVVSIQLKEIDEIINSFGADKELARKVFTRMSQFGKLESINDLNRELKPLIKQGYTLLTEKFPASSTAAYSYINFKTYHEDEEIKTFSNNFYNNKKWYNKTCVLVDETVMEKLKTDKRLVQELKDIEVVFVFPENWLSPTTCFYQGSRNEIKDYISKTVKIAKKLKYREGLSDEKAVEEAISAPVKKLFKQLKLEDQLEIVTNSKYKLSKEASTAQLFKRLNHSLVTQKQVEKTLENFSLTQQEAILKKFEFVNMREFSKMAKVQHKNIENYLKENGRLNGGEKYFVADTEKSYGLMNFIYKKANSVNADKFSTEKYNIKDNDSVIIIDDFAGSGESLEDQAAVSPSLGHKKGRLLLAPTVIDPVAAEVFETAGYDYAKARTTKDAPKVYDGLVGGYGGVNTGIVFPYMAPDCNLSCINDFLTQLKEHGFDITLNGCGIKFC